MEEKKDLEEHQEKDIEAQLGLEDLLAAGFTIIVIVVGLSYGLDLTTDVRDDFTVDSIEYNATQDGITAIAKIPKKLPMIVTIVIAGVVIGMLVRYLWIRMKEG